MFKNYLKIAFRNLWKHRVFSGINVLGLTVGMTACFLIFLYVKFELSYDSFHSKADRIYRIVCDLKTPSDLMHTGGPAWAVGAHIKQDFPQIEAAVRVAGNSLLVRKGNVKFQEKKSAFADSTFFRIFDFPLIKGNPKTALTEPNTVVFSESAAKKYFGTTDPLGQTVLLTGEGTPTKVTGIMKDMPENTLLNADMLVSMCTITVQKDSNRSLDNQWGNYGEQTFILLTPGANPQALTAQLPAFLERHNGDEMKKMSMFPTLLLEKLRRVYLYSTRDGSKTGNIANVYIFSIVAVFILLIACFNFVNLTTARSVERAKEVGIRKVVGAMKWNLAIQFIGESVILCLIACLITIGLSALLLPSFNVLSGKQISDGIFSHPGYLLVLLLSSIAIGLVAGFYPAVVLSSFRPVVVLKGRFSTGTKGILLRKGLVVSQFVISISLIVATIIVYRQLNYMRGMDLGFQKGLRMVIETNGDPAKLTFKQAVTNIPGVEQTAMSGSVPGGGNPGAYSEIQNKKGELQIANLPLYFVDFDYISFYDMKMLAGRSFNRSFMTDTTQSMILNEAALIAFGYKTPQEAVGRRFRQWGREGQIIGVVKNFHFESPQLAISPLSMRIEPDGCDLVSIKVSGDHLPQTIAAIEKKWNELVPARPFSYFFLDEFFDRQYKGQERFEKLFINFAVLAIIISCLGLLGLASYSTLQRTREIGIRKVLGASVPGIVNLLSKDFLILVGIAILIATPITWILMDHWLTDFAYRSPIGWWIFLVAGVLAALIAVITVSFQAIKAAIANPIKSLRTE